MDREKNKNTVSTKNSRSNNQIKVKAEHIENQERVYKVKTEMDHLVLIPQDFNLVVTSENMPQVTVWSNQRIAQGTIYYPFQGTVRIDKLNVFSTANDDDVSLQRIFIPKRFS